MKTLLVIAKALSIDAGAEQTELPHVRAALRFVEPVDEKTYGQLLSYLHLDRTTLGETLPGAHTLFSAAHNAPRRLFAQDVRQMLEKFNFNELIFRLPGELRAAPSSAPQTDAINIELVRQELEMNLFDQQTAIDEICQRLESARYDTKRNGPLAAFVFMGPANSGKRLAAQVIAASAKGDRPLKIIEMSSYQSDNEAWGLTGMRRGYNNARPGDLTRFLHEHPKGVVVLNNFTMAHPNAQALLTPLLASGFLEDPYGFGTDADNSRVATDTLVDCRQAIVIFTTTAGNDIYDNLPLLERLRQAGENGQSLLLQSLAGTTSSYRNAGAAISPGLLDQLKSTTLVMFSRLGVRGLESIARQSLDKIAMRFAEHEGMALHWENPAEIATLMVLAAGPDPSPRSLAEHVLARRLLGILRKDRANTANTAASHIPCRLDKPARKALHEIVARLEGDDRLKNLFRKRQRVTFDVHVLSRDLGSCLVLRNPELESVTDPGDYEGAGAIAVELPTTRFATIAGHHAVKARMAEVLQLLRNPQQIRQYNIDIPRGILLYGPPGTGKTMLAKALAAEAELPFIPTTGSEIQNPAFIRFLFQRARRYAPTIVFIDEIDAIGTRGRGGFDEPINELLVAIDGFASGRDTPVFVVAATNLPAKIDPALLRPGRIDLHIEVPALDRDARGYFADRYLELPHDGSVNRDMLLDISTGMSGAELEKVRREAVLDMLRRGIEKIDHGLLVEHINIVKYGVRDQRPRSRDNLLHAAYHEAGHAIASLILNPDIRIEQVSIIQRANMGGFVAFDQESAQGKRMTRKEIQDELVIALAGRCAQIIKFGEDGIDMGASADLKRAAHIAFQAIVQGGMDQELGMGITWPADTSSPPWPEEIQIAVRKWITEAQDKAKEILTAHWDDVANLVSKLLAQETVSNSELKGLPTNLIAG